MLFKLPWCFNSIFAGAVLILLCMNVFVIGILVYLFVRFIGGFILPLFRTTMHVHRQFRNTNSQGNRRSENPNQAGATTNGQPDPAKSGSSKVGEYIDFEEVK
jgi:hypothetical protein